MNSLPQEILDNIAALHYKDQVKKKRPASSAASSATSLPGQPLLATVSRRWQWAFERQSFSQIHLKSSGLDAFRQVITGQRRRFVRWIFYTILLPAYTPEACTQFEREADRQLNNAAFTVAISELFQLLQSWGSNDALGNPYSLQVRVDRVYSTMDYDHRTSAIPFPREHSQGARIDSTGRNYPRDLQQYRFVYSSLHLLPCVDIPMVPAIRTFTISRNGNTSRTIAPESALRILTKLPTLRNCYLQFDDKPVDYPAVRRGRRDAFAQALGNAQFPSSVEILSIDMGPPWILDASWNPTRLLHPGEKYELLNSALRRATADLPCLAIVHLKGIIEPSFFWPKNAEGPALAECAKAIAAEITTEETRMPPGYGFDEEEDLHAALQFDLSLYDASTGWQESDTRSRTRVDERLVNPLIEAFATACIQMPMLRTAYLMTELQEPVEFDDRVDPFPANWAIYYSAPGYYHTANHDKMMAPYPPESAWQRTLTFDVRGWRLNEKLSGLLRNIGQDKHSKEPIERYIDQWARFGKPELFARLTQQVEEQ
ncbi:hypothetical protein BKA65DRAFT_551587 [Rhexocercosporidium sp. MPI-PUGE-AT-0058]|nr:hypothetical protein BKA65DRAFT_551587 [Rhexocercosporidium sp. MPI-PUGE-AT-0058]